MWVLLQFISGSIQRKPVSFFEKSETCYPSKNSPVNVFSLFLSQLDCFLPVLRLYDLLYPETEPLPFPDVNNFLCTHQLAITCIWIHLLCKAQTEKRTLQRTIPNNLKAHYE